jgi:hypothetical protein
MLDSCALSASRALQSRSAIIEFMIPTSSLLIFPSLSEKEPVKISSLHMGREGNNEEGTQKRERDRINLLLSPEPVAESIFAPETSPVPKFRGIEPDDGAARQAKLFAKVRSKSYR